MWQSFKQKVRKGNDHEEIHFLVIYTKQILDIAYFDVIVDLANESKTIY